MPLPFLAAIAALTVKEIGVLVTTTAISTLAASIVHDGYQKAKDAANSSDRDSKDRRE